MRWRGLSVAPCAPRALWAFLRPLGLSPPSPVRVHCVLLRLFFTKKAGAIK
jgi:hypothetical protein